MKSFKFSLILKDINGCKKLSKWEIKIFYPWNFAVKVSVLLLPHSHTNRCLWIWEGDAPSQQGDSNDQQISLGPDGDRGSGGL